MSLDLGQLVGSLKIDTAPLDKALSHGDAAIKGFGSSAGAQAKVAGDQIGVGIADGASDAIDHLRTTLPTNAKGAIIRTSAEFQALSPAVRKAVDDAEAQARFDKLPAGAKDAIRQAEAAIEAGGAGVAAAAGKVGDEAGDDLRDQLRDGAKDAGKAAGAAAGVALGAGVLDNLSVEAGRNKLSSQLGLTAGDARLAGTLAGKVYGDNFGESLDDVNDAVGAVVKNTGLQLGSVDIQPAVEKVLTLRDVFDQDLGATTAAAGQMVKTGMAKNIAEALDIITVGLQGPANKADDLLDTFNEYGTQFRKVGLDGKTSLGLLQQALAAGARDSDVAADAIKEFSLRSQEALFTLDSKGREQLTAVGQAFVNLGLDGQKMQEKLAGGGKPAAAALDTIMDRLRAIPDPIQRTQTAVALFGTQAEDLGDALYAMDPSKAAAGLGKVGGAADEVTKKMGSGTQASIDSYKRKLIEMGRGAIESTGPTAAAAGAIAAVAPAAMGVIGPLGSLVAARAAQTAAAAAAGSAETAAATASQRSWIKTAASAVAGGARTAAGWLLAGATSVAGYVASLVVAAGATAARWTMMGVQALAGAARMAAAWLIAMGPIGVAIAAIVGVGVLIYKNWDKIKQWTAAAWDWVVDKVKAVPGLLVKAFLNFTLVGQIIKHWDDIQDATKTAWDWVVGFVKGIPGKLVGFFVGFALPIITQFLKLKDGAVEKGVALVTWMRGLPGRIITALVGLGAQLAVSARGHFQRFRDAAGEKVTATLNWVAGIPGSIVRRIGGLGSLLRSKGVDVISGLYNGVTDRFANLRDWVSGIGQRVKNALGGVRYLLWNAGVNIVSGLLDGLVARFRDIMSYVGKMTAWIRDHKGPKSVDLQLWRPAGNWIVQGLMTGLDEQMPALQSKVGDITASLSTSPAGSLNGALTASSVRVPPSSEVSSYAARQGAAATTREGDTFHVYETTDPHATAMEVSRQQALAGAGG